jgi:hypothetical protein
VASPLVLLIYVRNSILRTIWLAKPYTKANRYFIHAPADASQLQQIFTSTVRGAETQLILASSSHTHAKRGKDVSSLLSIHFLHTPHQAAKKRCPLRPQTNDELHTVSVSKAKKQTNLHTVSEKQQILKRHAALLTSWQTLQELLHASTDLTFKISAFCTHGALIWSKLHKLLNIIHTVLCVCSHTCIY